jgi:hypothetical protein
MSEILSKCAVCGQGGFTERGLKAHQGTKACRRRAGTARHLTDAQFEALQASLNTAIHEIVFACQHACDDEFDDACTCLVTAQGTMDRVADALIASMKRSSSSVMS